ncbi:RNA-binding protein YlmH [Bacilli bacterium PM5-3]|nr:RNA-binding protein YlmH [Bacilli bacterium PM5-3]MDH6603226.1 RNA-binding protein YlmH [Bacilli bacterium PM5-9]
MKQKNSLKQYILHNKEYESLIIRVENAISEVLRSNSFKILFFVSKKEEQIIRECLNHFSGVNCDFISKIINSDYKMALFVSDDIISNEIDTTTLYKIKFNNKFNTVDHRDVLGSLMALNISRNLIGDIVIDNNYIYFEIVSSLNKYLKENLLKIKNINVNLEESSSEITKHQNFSYFQGIVKSFRLDNIVKLITKQSSNQVRDYILSGNVKVNQIETTNFSKSCLDNDVISLKGYGRFIVVIDTSRKTKKDNYVLEYKKYV